MEVIRTHEGDGYRVVLALVRPQGWFVAVRENDKCTTECGPIGARKANAIFAQASRAEGYVQACVVVHKHRQAKVH